MSDLKFVVVGNPNEGKSSVVSTLTESSIRITEKPGETEFSTSYSLIIDGEKLLTFVDTPGFQTAKKTKKWIEEEAGSSSIDEWGEQYQKDHKGKSAYKHDARVLSAIAGADCLLYIVDTSKPVGPDDRAEMDILRRSGKPKMAVFNKKKDLSDFDQEWHEAIRIEFGGICHEFNALNADFNERIALIEKLKAVDRSWENVIDEVIAGLKDDLDCRIKDVVEVIQNLLKKCLSEKCVYQMKKHSDKEQVAASLAGELQEKIRNHEKKAHKKIKSIFKHEKVGVKQDSFDVPSDDLFSKDVVKAFGLNRKQFAVINAVAGAAGGAVVDVAFGGITFGVFTAIGTVGGALTGHFGAKPISGMKVKIQHLPVNVGASGTEISIQKGSQLPYILIDRAFCYYSAISNRSHAHGKADVEVGVGEGTTLTSEWFKSDLICTEKYFSKLRKGKNGESDDKKFCAVLKRRMVDDG